jgi:hypothetical protein
MTALSPIIMLPVFIQDNFYTDPDKVRAYALEQVYDVEYPSKNWNEPSIDKLWPGFATQLLHREKFIDQAVSKLIGKPVRSKEQSGFFRLSKANDSYDVKSHVDYIPGKSTLKQYQGIIYLSLPLYCTGKTGTNFLRHKDTGKIKIESTAEYWYLQNDFKLSDKWEVYFSTECVFNRLVVFESNYFHDVGEIFGDNIENGRLAQILNFHEI